MAFSPAIRGIMEFQLGDYGWSETHWWVGAPNTYQGALTALYNLAGYRSVLLGSDAVLTNIKVTDDNLFRDSEEEPVNFTVTSNKIATLKPGVNEVCAGANDALLVRAEADPLTRKSIFLGGIPQSVMRWILALMPANPVNYVTVWNNYFGIRDPDSQHYPVNSYAGQLCLNWGFKIANRDPLTNRAYKRALAVGSQTAGLITSITMANVGSGYGAAPAYLAPNTVAVRGKTGTGFQGTLDIVGDHVASVAITAPGTGYSDPIKVFISPPGFNIKQYVTLLQQGYCTRRRGRPFGLRRGRARSA